jgi:DNA-binding MarR family transcriptional regulator
MLETNEYTHQFGKIGMSANEPSILDSMRIIEKISHSYIHNALAPLGINRYEMSVLLMVYKKNGISRREVLTESYGEGTGIGVAIKALNDKGYINRKPDLEDRRAQSLYITEDGLALKEDIIEINRALERYLTSSLAPRELDLFKDVIANLCSELKYKNGREAKS